jgi:hypothetical protein
MEPLFFIIEARASGYTRSKSFRIHPKQELQDEAEARASGYTRSKSFRIHPKQELQDTIR